MRGLQSTIRPNRGQRHFEVFSNKPPIAIAERPQQFTHSRRGSESGPVAAPDRVAATHEDDGIVRVAALATLAVEALRPQLVR